MILYDLFTNHLFGGLVGPQSEDVSRPRRRAAPEASRTAGIIYPDGLSRTENFAGTIG